MKKTPMSLAIALAMALAVAACSSDDDDGNDAGGTDAGTGGDTGSSTSGDNGATTGGSGSSTFQLNGQDVSISGDVSQFGIVTVDEDSTIGQEVDASGVFFDMNQSLPFGDVASALGARQLDTCDVYEVDTDIDPFEIIESIIDSIVTVPAGEVITLNSSAGTYGSMVPTSAFGPTFYESQSELTLPTPDTITVSVPGDEFPAMTVSAAKPPTITEFSPGFFTEVTADTVFTWNVDGSSAGTLDISIGTGFGLSGTAADLGISGATAECVVENDGSFSLPGSVWSELSAIAGDSTLYLYGADAYSFGIEQSGSSILLFTRTATVGYATP